MQAPSTSFFVKSQHARTHLRYDESDAGLAIVPPSSNANVSKLPQHGSSFNFVGDPGSSSKQ